MERLEEVLQHEAVHETGWIQTERIPFSQQVIDACAQNFCGKYNTCWTCPPARGSLEEMRAELLDFSQAYLFTYKGLLEDSFDIEGMTRAREEAAEILQELSAKLSRHGVEHMRLGVGGCSICPKCSYPDAPCRHPDRVVNSIESCGVDVVTLASLCGMHYHNGANTVTYFMALLVP